MAGKKISKDDSNSFEKHTAEMHDYFGESAEEADILHLSTEKGHLQEFYHEESQFMYYVIEGEGTFYLDREPVEVEKGDLVVAPPETKIYYLGKMELLLVCSPPWTEEENIHVRYVDENGETVPKSEREE